MLTTRHGVLRVALPLGLRLPANKSAAMGGSSAAPITSIPGSDLQLTEQQISELREAFQLFDKDGDGHVTPKELLIVLQTLGQQPTIETVQSMIDEVDKDGNQEIEFEEFCVLMCKNMSEKEDIKTLQEAFKILDIDNSGSITHKELKDLMRSFSRLGEDIADDEIDALIAQADVDGDGQISYEEVRLIFCFRPCSARAHACLAHTCACNLSTHARVPHLLFISNVTSGARSSPK
jgi:Ca2+-binding EF-hand superfamily protein